VNVLVIPEDFRKDQHILKPIISAMFSFLGKPKAIVRILTDPLLGGVSEATKWERIQEIIELNGDVELFLLCIDRDGRDGRRKTLKNIEENADKILSGGKKLLAENAWQEIEVWVLAGHDLPKEWSWTEIRNENNPKETYFIPFAKLRKVEQSEAEGRKTLADEAAKKYGRIRKLCPEDIQDLERRIKTWLESDI